MKVMTREKAKQLIDQSGSTVKDTQKQAQRQARETIRDARKQARRQVTRARIAGVKLRAQGRARASGVSTKAVGAAGAVGLAAGYFLDPDSGKRRRHIARDRAAGLIRRGADKARRETEFATGTVEGMVKDAKSRTAPEKPAPNDQALAERVKSEIFQPADAPKGSVNVNVEDGVVYLRGQVKRADQVRKLVEEAGAVDGVRGVENLLQTP
jgi:osmotically-inducible protein OsmY